MWDVKNVCEGLETDRCMEEEEEEEEERRKGLRVALFGGITLAKEPSNKVMLSGIKGTNTFGRTLTQFFN
ncbi:hypothetical protein BCR33DRAFT_719196 [Rhizoclosmatium globosum]|uniref:Uncharacterized protein n=1 Tax=Rhizoclosmatium globosum TaxID=329046 RepID=A0A1Y2C104_9FUNG|nr:hypothetical protein BCR33DRAFT_719196 [Rhizoclosmatium globosum]|eukprot:ORY40646.1 hypothetical protein BCR33DRAFT_719196 [Rhizoclosmatium globosum]